MVAKWSTDEEEESGNMSLATGEYLGFYGLFGLGQIVFSVLGSFFLATGGISRKIHKQLLVNILRLPMSFFDTTPSGQILNRFSKDINTIDETVPGYIQSLVFTCFTVLSTIFVISYATPLFMIVILPLAVLYLLIQRFYVATLRQLKQLESVSRSPIYTHLQETIHGVTSISAYHHQKRFIVESECRVDENLAKYYPSICANSNNIGLQFTALTNYTGEEPRTEVI